LVGARLEVQVPEGSKWSGAGTEPEPKRIPEHSRRAIIPRLLRDGVLELGWADLFKAAEDAGDLHVSTA
jgi:hypothetical protein